PPPTSPPFPYTTLFRSKSAMIARLSGARRIYGFARDALREPASRVLLHETVAIPPQTHVIRKNLSLVHGALGIPVPDDADELERSEEHTSELQSQSNLV